MSLDNQRNLKLAIHRDAVFMEAAKQVADEMNRWAREFFGRETIPRLAEAARLHDEDLPPARPSPRRPPHSPRRRLRLLGLHRRRHALHRQQSARASRNRLLARSVSAEDSNGRRGGALERHPRRARRTGGLADGTIKVYVLVEQFETCFQLMEIRAALGRHFIGFNTGRWDYINSVSDAMAWDPDFVNPNIDTITMTYGYMRNYEDRVRRAVQHARQARSVRAVAGRDGAEHPGRIRDQASRQHEAGGGRRRTRAARRRQRQVGGPLEDGPHRAACMGTSRTRQPTRAALPASHLCTPADADG